MTRRDGFEIDSVAESLNNSPFEGFTIERASRGTSTEVYRMDNGKTVFYLRVAEEGKTLEPEAEAYRLCREKGALVPEVVLLNHDPVLNRSVVITTEIPGVAIEEVEKISPRILREAGRNLALINKISVSGIGLINNDGGASGLAANGQTYKDFLLNNFEEKIERLAGIGLLDIESASRTKEYITERLGLFLSYTQGHLSHGDFDVAHIFAKDGKFSGIIDFGDMRGTSIYHDLAHFFTYNQALFGDLFKGYCEITPLDNDALPRIEAEAVLTGIDKLYWMAGQKIPRLEKMKKNIKRIQKIID